jgi:hypothetical protein
MILKSNNCSDGMIYLNCNDLDQITNRLFKEAYEKIISHTFYYLATTRGMDMDAKNYINRKQMECYRTKRFSQNQA